MSPYEQGISLAYLRAKHLVLAAGFGQEIVCCVPSPFLEISEQDFLREAAWVILSVGMRENVIKKKFSAVSASFQNWASSKSIVDDSENCVREALSHYGHVGKIGAILYLCKILSEVEFDDWLASLFLDPINSFREFPFFGEAAARHLAKNLGFNVPKPDRHLTRIALSHGYLSVDQFCMEIARSVGDPIRVVDSVLWRFATLNRDYLSVFKSFQSD